MRFSLKNLIEIKALWDFNKIKFYWYCCWAKKSKFLINFIFSVLFNLKSVAFMHLNSTFCKNGKILQISWNSNFSAAATGTDWLVEKSKFFEKMTLLFLCVQIKHLVLLSWLLIEIFVKVAKFLKISWGHVLLILPNRPSWNIRIC